MLQQRGLLNYHVMGDPHCRGNALVLQTPPPCRGAGRTRGQGRKVEWVIGMWPRSYAQPPDVMAIEKWVTED